MKFIYSLSFAAIISMSLFSCVKSNVTPTQNVKVDTSKTLISSTILVGNWNVLTDTISFQGTNTNYFGQPADHYIFTKYGNLFINEGPYSFVDTAIYQVSALKQQVGWVNSYYSVNGTAIRQQTTTAPFDFILKGADTLILTSNVQTSAGPRYEQIVFKKQ